MEHITPFINKIDKSVSEYPTFISLEKTTGIPKGYLALVGGVALALITLFDLGAQFFTNLILIAYPALRILDLNHSAVTAAANEKNVEELRTWSNYFVIFGGMVTLESIIVSWVPFWYAIKLVGMAWLFLPETMGINIAQKTIIDMYEPYAKKLMNEKTE